MPVSVIWAEPGQRRLPWISLRCTDTGRLRSQPVVDVEFPEFACVAVHPGWPELVKGKQTIRSRLATIGRGSGPGCDLNQSELGGVYLTK